RTPNAEGPTPKAQRPTPNAHAAALSLLAEATWLNGYHGYMRGVAGRGENGKQLRVPYPYQDVKAEGVLRRLIREYPDGQVRDQAQYTIGMFLQGDGEVQAAVTEFRRFMAERPNSKWA